MGLLSMACRAMPADVDEEAHFLPDPLAGAVSVAAAKLAATPATEADECVVAADTLVVLDGRVLAKPADEADATRMLRSLRARGHDVLTGVALRDPSQRTWAAVVATRVEMRAYADDEIAAYVARGEPFDKAGGYAVQDQVFTPVARLDGCYLNVVGLPLCAVAAGLRALNVDVAAASAPPCDYCRAGARLVSIG